MARCASEAQAGPDGKSMTNITQNASSQPSEKPGANVPGKTEILAGQLRDRWKPTAATSTVASTPSLKPAAGMAANTGVKLNTGSVKAAVTGAPSMRPNGRIADTPSEKPKPPEPRPNAGPNPNEPDARLWARAWRANTPVKLRLVCGDVIEGVVIGYGLYSVCLSTADGELTVIWKHAMVSATTTTATTGARP